MCWQTLLHTRDRLPTIALDDWYASLLARLGDPSPFALAVLGGRLAQTPGLAFLAGYQGALRGLWPAAPRSLGALCVTEGRSTRPADLGMRIDALHLSGRKDFVTAGDAADWLLVAAREEEQGAAPRLAMAVVRNGDPGVRIESRPALSLMPDIAHASLHLDQAPCERLPGDGWNAYAKPFRTLEDLYVLAALGAWLFGVGQDNAWPQALSLRLLALLAGCGQVARLSPDEPAGHLLLGGLFAQFDELRAELDSALAAGPPQWAGLWQRDRGVLDIARGARDKRLLNAWQSITG